MPQGKTYVKIASQTLSGTASSVTFSNLPQNFTDLIVVVAGTYTTGGTNDAVLQFNSDTGSNYSWTRLLGNGSAGSSSRSTNDVQIDFGLISSTNQSNSIAHIQNYSNGATYKTVIGRGNSTEYVGAVVGTWRNTSAITSITVKSAATYSSGTTFSIYGIEAAKAPKAEGGDKVWSDGTYWIHQFNYSGTFVPKTALTCDYLVVAGGGGGGYLLGGGGGAGGLRSTVTATGGGGSLESSLSLSAANAYTITVGGGAPGGATYQVNALNGSNSSISGTGITTVTSTSGGGGASYLTSSTTGNTGGSGGGATSYESGGSANGGTGGSGTANQGYAGGNGYLASGGTFGAGGGGGANAVGSNGASRTGGNGGNGVAVSITGSSITYAGGGGGGTGHSSGNGTPGTGGTGGGGTGGNYVASPTNGTANLGAGGGGGGNSSYTTGGSGGSGIVIVRYPV